MHILINLVTNTVNYGEKSDKQAVNLPSPSPKPSSTLQNINAGTDVARKGVTEVETDHRNTANKRTAFPPNLLAAHAPITCNA
jgi:hypothetical protein